MSNEASSPTPISTKRRLPLRLLLALAGGGLAYLVFPNQGVWALMFPMFALIYLSVRGLRFWSAWLVGLVAGFVFFASQTFWLSMYLGPEPLVALSLLQALIFATFIAAGSAVVTRLRIRLDSKKTPFVVAALTAAFWVAREWFAGNYPYGGFPWARLVSAQSDTPISRWVWLGGMPLADFLIVLVSVLIIEALILGATFRKALASATLILGLFMVPLALPISTGAEDGTMTIAAAQGNANAGLFSNRESGRIFQNHMAATEELIASGENFDVLVWPENAIDLDVFGDPANFRKVEAFVKKINHPLIFGTVTQREKLFNTSVLWLPGKNMTDWYDKTKPVPFAEYVPDRAFWSALAPDLIGLLNYDFAAGTRDGIFELNGKKLGALICFEIAVDEVPQSLVNQGAEVILSQTNNSDFGRSDEAFQQLAIARLRAIETGRTLVNISTVGPSAVYLADGSKVAELGAFERGFMSSKVSLRTSKTPAMFTVFPLTALCVFIAIAATSWLIYSRIRGRGRR